MGSLLPEHRGHTDASAAAGDGRAFRAEQRRDHDLAGIPVVVCSGEPDADQEAKDLGASACVQKPIDFAALLRALWRVC